MIDLFQSKLFNGYILNPIQLIVCGILFLLISISIAIIGILGLYESQKSIDYHQLEQNIGFIEIDDKRSGIDYTYFIFNNSTELYIPTKAISNKNELITAIENNYEFTLICERKFIYQIDDQFGMNYATIDSTQNRLIEINRRNCVVSVFVFIVSVLGVVASGYILSNAPKYPRLASILVKKGSRNF